MTRIMPFGKHKGLPFDKIPSSYFDWLLKQEWLQAGLREEIEEFLEDGDEPSFDFESEGPREPAPPNEPPRLGFTAEEQVDLQRLLQTGFRALMLQREPDLGDGVRSRFQRLAEKLRKGGLMEEVK
jgi:hypothetical protein